jgi:catalase
MPKAIADPQSPEVAISPALSLMALPGERGIRTRQVAVLIEEGVRQASLVDLNDALAEAGAVIHFVGPRVGMFVSDSGDEIEANKSMENSPGVLFDVLVLPDGEAAVQALLGNGHTMEFVKDQFRHCKTILALGAGRELLEAAGIGPAM